MDGNGTTWQVWASLSAVAAVVSAWFWRHLALRVKVERLEQRVTDHLRTTASHHLRIEHEFRYIRDQLDTIRREQRGRQT